MNEIELQDDLAAGLSTRKIAAKYQTSQTAVRYWLRKFGLRSKIRAGSPNGSHVHCCKICGDTRPSNFYQRLKSVCKRCQNQKRTLEFVEKKKKAIEYFGGKCIKCGYAKYYGALEFHHRDTSLKEINPEKALKRSWKAALVELKKCDLLCSNCHREVHAGR